MREIKAVICIVGGLAVFLLILVLAQTPSPAPQSIADACKKQFPYSQQDALRCEFMTTGTIALEQADRRDADRKAKIDAVIRDAR